MRGTPHAVGLAVPCVYRYAPVTDDGAGLWIVFLYATNSSALTHDTTTHPVECDIDKLIQIFKRPPWPLSRMCCPPVLDLTCSVGTV